MRKLIDCITFFDNNYIFDFRYNVIKNYVDKFIICESLFDHKNNPCHDKHKYQFSEYKFFRKIYSKFSLNQKKNCLKIGEKFILNRFSGKTGGLTGSTYISKSSFKKSKKITCVECSCFKSSKLYLFILFTKKYKTKKIPMLYHNGNFWIIYPSQATKIKEKIIDL